MKIRIRRMLFFKITLVVAICLFAIFEIAFLFAKRESVKKIKNIVASSVLIAPDYIDYVGGRFQRESVFMFKCKKENCSALDKFIHEANRAQKDGILQMCREVALTLEANLPVNADSEVFVLRLETDTIMRIDCRDDVFLFFFGNACY